MEVRDFDGITSGFYERVRRLALFDSLNELARMKRTDKLNKQIDMNGLGLLTLLFFFEQKLIRNNKVGVKDLAQYLFDLSSNVYQLDLESSEEIARLIIQTFRPTTGKKREYSFFNWETKNNDIIYYSILKANSFDISTNTQYYTLDEDGLELIFATKEFYNEFHLSINQLMLRKQLEKGEFKGALRQINEMHIDVESLQDRMIKLQHEIQRNIVSEDTYNRYQKLLEDIYYRLYRENEEFVELHQFITETKNRLFYQDNIEKENDTYQLILKIGIELEKVHKKHTTLLQESIDLKNKALRAAQESLYYIGVNSFNFDQDITSKIISVPLPLETMKGILVPFLKIQETKQWSLLTVFAEQNITEDNDLVSDDSFLEIDVNIENEEFRNIQAKNYAYIFTKFLEVSKGRNIYKLVDFIEYIKENDDLSILEKRSFYDFWILLHQKSPISNNDKLIENDEKGHLLDGILNLIGTKKLIVKELPEIIRVTSRYSIQDMEIRLEEKENAI